MKASAPLLHRLQGLIERTYDLDTGAIRAGEFVIGDDGLLALYRARRVVGRRPEPGAGPMLLVREDADGRPRVRLYYPDGLIRNLERHDPSRGLGPPNLRDFAAFVEELDHLLVVAAAARAGRPVRGLELEMHANVTKWLTCSLFLARSLRQARLDPVRRHALRHELFGRGDYGAEEPELAERYRAARHHALRFLRRLERTGPAARPSLLRRFSRSPLPDKLRLCA